jgi:glutathione peroxidase
MAASIYDIPLVRIDGTQATLAEYAARVLLVVNVASRCGLTPQYEGLESLYRTYGARGLVVLGFPSNDFNGQEPGSDAEISEFCRSKYGVEFPMFAKIKVTGPGRHPLYEELTRAVPDAEFRPDSRLKARLSRIGRYDADINWNFEKFLVDRKGIPVRRFAPDTAPTDEVVIDAIEAALAA